MSWYGVPYRSAGAVSHGGHQHPVLEFMGFESPSRNLHRRKARPRFPGNGTFFHLHERRKPRATDPLHASVPQQMTGKGDNDFLSGAGARRRRASVCPSSAMWYKSMPYWTTAIRSGVLSDTESLRNSLKIASALRLADIRAVVGGVVDRVQAAADAAGFVIQLHAVDAADVFAGHGLCGTPPFPGHGSRPGPGRAADRCAGPTHGTKACHFPRKAVGTGLNRRFPGT